MMPGVLWLADQHEPLTELAWEDRLAREAIESIVLDAEGAARDGFWPGHPLDEVGPQKRFATLYLGSAGMVWGLWKLGAAFDGPATLATGLERYRAEPDFADRAHPPSLLMGEAGLLVVAARVESPLADRERLRALVRENREHPTWELMWGSPGTILAARACGLGAEAEESARLLWERWDRDSDLWTQDLYGVTRQMLGPAHGLAGNVHALRGYVEHNVLCDRVARGLERTALREDGLVNWLPSIGESPSKLRVQWCHGAPGIVSTLGDLIPYNLALAAGELTWRAGPLTKGPGLCHGTAGNGFAFLRLYELTGNEEWLGRARRFAMHATEQVKRERAAVGRGRYTLWTGDIGVALYLQACLDADARFPILDVL